MGLEGTFAEIHVSPGTGERVAALTGFLKLPTGKRGGEGRIGPD